MSKKLVIVGGVAGGATAAARARRLDEDAEIVRFERGRDVSFANCGLPCYAGGQRSYYACWFLRQKNIRCKNIVGGFKVFRYVQAGQSAGVSASGG